MKQGDIIKSIGLRTEVVAEVLGVKRQTINAWACGAVKIPEDRVKQLIDLKEAVRQIIQEKSK